MLIITSGEYYLFTEQTGGDRQTQTRPPLGGSWDMTTDPSCLPPPPLHFKLKTNLSPDHLIIDFVYFALVLPTRFS